jgi:ribosome maturation factor RimP
MFEDVVLKLRPLFSAHLERLGFILVDIRFYRNNEGALILEALADRAEGGITLAECTRFNAELGGIAEENASIPARYTLEVSSPGTDRPLVILSDFRRVIGRKVRVFLKEPYDGKIEHLGSVEAVGAGAISIKTENKTIIIPLEKVNRAKQVVL